MNKLPLEEIDVGVARKDFFSTLSAWLIFEVFSFFLLPGFKLIPAGQKHATWFLISVLLGVLGTILVVVSSQFIFLCQTYLHGGNKKLLLWLGQLGGWLGLAGVGFPLIIVGLELWLLLQA